MTRNRWTILAVLFLARTAMAVQFQSVGSLGPILAHDLALDYAAVGTLIGLYMLPGVVIALPAQALRAESRAPGMGVFYTCYYAAMAVLPGLAGMAHDLAGSPAAPVLVAAAMMLAALIFLAGFVAVARERKVMAAPARS